MTRMNRWIVTTDPLSLRRLGKTMEELGELGEVLARMLSAPPSTYELHRQQITNEIADVRAQCAVSIKALGLDRAAINQHCVDRQAADVARPLPLPSLSKAVAALTKVCARCIIQGIDEIDPGTGLTNRQRITDAIAAVLSECTRTANSLSLDAAALDAREKEKTRQMGEWEALYRTPAAQEA
jgi:hypothetical protein